MPDHRSSVSGKILLVSAPWALFDRPSLPIGSLKAYLAKHLPGLQVECAHLYLMMARTLEYRLYQRVSQRVWRAESVFSALLYPDRAPHAESLFYRTLPRKDAGTVDFKALVRQARQVADDWLATIDWTTVDLIGFTISFCQVTASLYLISRIKQRRASLPVVVGGSSFSGQQSAGLLNAFSGIDYLVMGEGERPLTELLRGLMAPARPRTSVSLPDSIVVAAVDGKRPSRFTQLRRLDDLPVPDYDDYFATLAGFPASHRFFPTLPIEASRGCWWHGSDQAGLFNGCAFCNLNLQWQGYRTKSAGRIIQETHRLVQRYQVLSVAFADNAFPLNRADAVFDGIAGMGYDLSIFAELRAATPPHLLVKMKNAGVETVQVGIESLSTRLLSKMNKGVSCIDNLNIMKHCEAAGIICASNLMLHFPSSNAADVRETLAALEFARWYRPLKVISFWLGLESPVYRHASQFGIRCTFNHPNLKKLFPASVANALRFIVQGYRGDRKRQQRLWRPVETKVRQWESDYTVMRRQAGGRPPLQFREGRRFLIIEQRFVRHPVVKHRLRGISAEIYRFCSVPRSLDEISEAAASHRPEQIQAFLAAMVEKRLMFEEQSRFLSLAVPRPGSS